MDLAITIADWVFFLSIIAAFIVSIIHREKKDLRPIQLYIVVSIVLNATLKIIEAFSSTNKNIETAIINIFSTLEITILYYYLVKRITRMKFQISMLIFLATYFLACIILWTVKEEGVFFYSPNLFGVEGFLLTIPCLFYVLEILNSDTYFDLKANEHFIVSCGILFYFSITIPSYFGWYNLYYSDPTFYKLVIISNYIFYTVFFITIIKAYLCTTIKPLP